jgi:hypothetical protein
VKKTSSFAAALPKIWRPQSAAKSLVQRDRMAGVRRSILRPLAFPHYPNAIFLKPPSVRSWKDERFDKFCSWQIPMPGEGAEAGREQLVYGGIVVNVATCHKDIRERLGERPGEPVYENVMVTNADPAIGRNPAFVLDLSTLGRLGCGHDPQRRDPFGHRVTINWRRQINDLVSPLFDVDVVVEIADHACGLLKSIMSAIADFCRCEDFFVQD